MPQTQSIGLQSLKFSFSHKPIQSVSHNETGTLIELKELITSPSAKAKFVQVQNMTRSLYEGYHTKTQFDKLKSDIDRAKQKLGFYFPSGTNERGHSADGLDFNGCIGFDYDFHFKGGDIIAKGLKEALKQFDYISFLHYSSGRYGLKGIIQTDLKECDSDLYRFAENQIFTHLASCGITLQHDPHGYGKTCYFAYDKQPYLNLNTKAFHIDLETYEKVKAVKQAQNERKTNVKHDDNEVKQAIEFLIENKINVASSYNEYLSFTGACLSTFGTDGGDIAFQILENSEQFNISTFKQNFDAHVKSLSMPTNGNRATERTILHHAFESGFKYEKKQQSKRLDEPITHIEAKQGEYLSDILLKEGAIFTGDFFNNTQVVAPTGTGKGVMISKIRGKKIVVCPTNALCNNFKKHGAIVHTGVNFSNRDEVLEADFIATTNANLPNLLTIIDPQNYHCAVDESHNFTASASKKFMLKDLKRTLRLSKGFASRSFWTGTELYNFHRDFEGMKKIIVSIPKPNKQALIVECKSVIQTTINQAIESVKSGRFPIILLNNRKELLKQAIEALKGYDFEVLNSDEKETAFFKELTETGNIQAQVKGIITTSVIKEGNDIYNELDFDFIVCNTHESIFHSVEVEQLVNRARKPISVNVHILKSKNRKKFLDTFDPNECKKYIERHTITRCNELNNCPLQYLSFEKNAQFGNDYAVVENERTGKFELCELLLSYKVFEAERRFELSNEAYQRTQLEKYGFVFGDTIGDNTAESDELKEVFATEREMRKEQKHNDFEATKQDILEQIELSGDVILPNTDTASEGKSFAVKCFERLTEIGVQPNKVFKLVEKEDVTNDAHLSKLVKSVSLFQLSQNDDYMNRNSLTAMQIKLVNDSIEVGKKYSTGQLRGFMRRALNLEKGFNTRMFDKNTTSQQVLDFTRLFFGISKQRKTGLYIVLGGTNYREYIIEDENKFVHPNALKTIVL